jgi:hypothetical protein
MWPKICIDVKIYTCIEIRDEREREKNTTPWLGAVSNSSSLLQLIKFRRYFLGCRRNAIIKVQTPGRSPFSDGRAQVKLMLAQQ